jgi:hypothetical protein
MFLTSTKAAPGVLGLGIPVWLGQVKNPKNSNCKITQVSKTGADIKTGGIATERPTPDEGVHLANPIMPREEEILPWCKLVDKPRKDGIMISSPCRECPKRNLPKNLCLHTCKLIQGLQDIQLTARENDVRTALDYTEQSYFRFMPTSTRHSHYD